MANSAEDFYSKQIIETKNQNLYKDERIITSGQSSNIDVNNTQVVNLCSNNYLGLSSHPDIIEAACIGVDDEKTTEAVKLFVVKSNPNLSIDEVLDYCRDNFTGYKVPKHIEFIDELPKSNVGKVLRRLLRD